MPLKTGVIDLSSPPPHGESSGPAQSSTVIDLDTQDKTSVTSTANMQQPHYLATLDRAAMERERLLRVSKSLGGGRPKREREMSDDDNDLNLNDASVDGDDGSAQKNMHVDNAFPAVVADATNGGPSKRVREDNSLQLPYPLGIVKKTAVNGYPRKGDDITIEEVLQPAKLRAAVLSAFQWHYEWILDKVFLGRTQLVLVVPAKGHEAREALRSMLSSVPNTRICTPNMDGLINCMHSKLQLLFYDTYLRVCVPSANLTNYDWGEGDGVIENIMYIHDFPLREKRHSAGAEIGRFAKELIYFVEAQGMFPDIVDRLRTEVLWQNTDSVRFVHSIGGEHREESRIWRTGYPGLSKAVKELGGNGRTEAQIDYVVSSMGSITPVLVEAIYKAATGKQLSISTYPRSSESSFAPIKSRIRVYFPTHDTVATSKGGFMSAGTICFSRSYWNKPAFPRQIIRDGRSVRRGCLMHDKIMFVRFEHPADLSDGTRVAGVVYIGSANMSESAWGKLVNDSATKRLKLNLRNWECGVVIQIPKSGRSESSQMKSVEETFTGLVPTPMETTLTEYNNKLPWFFTEAEWRKYH
ncbi:tyrosyl-DNA phosphodiesterase-domain-containing protein [Lipomyces tetrasporus]|uniref:Tyrosyl-DNA phosphodiesterase-domain-containing protein n=1 Tax=Lipomyces tetrasporus TaxID=54092 RepID=A0AAD7QVZ6_9ASCO|nr:tyrosyl-DNA phosphodiesterase-domain-containing protein [Lipomyces tetrasporus]KAJ8102211.1 tyrosyl-DNA phosphodiesterase-domain-containing protein [Lipomyces tetrasporus]